MQFEKDMNSEYKKLFLNTRLLLLSYEGIVETKKVRITTYGDANGGICHMRTTNIGVDIGFLKGSKMKDKYKKLTGDGKAIRVFSIGDFNKKIISFYIEQAIKLNSENR